MVTVTPHLHHAIGVLLVSEDANRGVFKPLLEAETAVPARRTHQYSAPKEGGDVIVRICEGLRDIKVTKPESKPKTNGKRPGSDADDADNDDSDADLSSDEEDQETREKIWKVGNVLGEAAIKGVKRGGKVEVMINVGSDLGVQITARQVGGKGGVRGILVKPSVIENGSA